MDVVQARSDTETNLVVADLIEKAKEYARASKAPATLKVYSTVWRIFTAWCDERGLNPLPATPEVIAAYVADRADDLRPQTVKKHLAGISQAHKLRGFESPVLTEPVRLTMQGLRRVKGVASHPKRALRVRHIKAMIASMPDNQVGVRDTAIILLAFVTGMRRSEIVALDVADVAWEPEGAGVTIRKSKRDQEGVGRQVPAPFGKHEATCSVRALRRWLAEAGHEEGALFHRLDPAAGHHQRLTGKAIARIVKRAAARAGLDPALVAGHSLRRGFCSASARAGAAERDIARATGHRSLTVLRSYVEEGELFERCAAKHLDL